ncbi:alanine racemase [Longispora fulva]|uniref:DNA-binding LacI/PurR family transcriptional regulator n=1 Tax=Longispora fulva TaxID=619741 RepID=A0A8J7GEI3_9ACTN|nr:LacI family DNA-binding transcriptional regulator [Longispora fulva]MBG6136241.1 DNA-binding LacI/PurR family transcriptional regulator [Longispora fulva]GIG63424.1 alanine racemase [Longispora fulva]
MATISDVARAAGVSRQTVSNALNAAHRLAPDTLARVTAAIEALGYRPDPTARSLRTGSRHAVAYPVPPDNPDRPNALMGGFLHCLVDEAGTRGFRILLTRTDRASIAEVIAARQVDGFVLSDVLSADPRLAELDAAGVPYVAFGRLGGSGGWVDVDSAAAMAEVVELLVAQGHRRVGYLGAAEDLPWMRDRRAGFLAAADRLGLTVESRPLPDALRAADRPTAIVAGDDWLGLAGYRMIGEAGLVPGRDVAVTGFNDLPLCDLVSPALTSVRIPVRLIARVLVGRLLDRLAGGPTPEHGALVAGELLVRASTPVRQG